MGNNPIIYTAKEPAGRINQLLEHILEGGDTLKVRQQDQTTAPFQYYLMRHLDENIGKIVFLNNHE
jgi:hypothetical protein